MWSMISRTIDPFPTASYITTRSVSPYIEKLSSLSALLEPLPEDYIPTKARKKIITVEAYIYRHPQPPKAARNILSLSLSLGFDVPLARSLPPLVCTRAGPKKKTRRASISCRCFIYKAAKGARQNGTRTGPDNGADAPAPSQGLM